MTRQLGRLLSALFLVSWVAAPLAGGGGLEINHACATATGCFPGDAPGYPVEISTGGRYELTGNLDLTAESAAVTAISVAAEDVTIDLRGFKIEGPCAGPAVPCSPTGSGAGVSASVFRNLTVLNGSVRGMGNVGIVAGDSARIEGVRATGNGFHGIRIGKRGVLRGNIAESNGGSGLVADAGSVVAQNTAADNDDDGITAVGDGVTIVANASWSNTRHGINALFGDNLGSVFADNTARSNGGFGIYGGFGSMIRHNAATGNAATGIRAWDGTALIGNAVRQNADGIVAESDTALSQNAVTDSTTSNLSGGTELDCNLVGLTLSCPP